MDFKSLDALFSSFSRGCNDEIYSEFIKVTFDFIDSLILIFRKYDAQLRDARNDLAKAVGNNNAKEVVHAFMEVMDPVKELVLTKDIKMLPVFKKIPAFEKIDIEADFKLLRPNTQNAIWNFLGKLIVLGNKAKKAEQVTAPLQDAQFREKLLRTTMQCEQEFTANGNEISSMDDIRKMAEQINQRMGTDMPK
jgi:hypothetical protein